MKFIIHLTFHGNSSWVAAERCYLTNFVFCSCGNSDIPSLRSVGAVLHFGRFTSIVRAALAVTELAALP